MAKVNLSKYLKNLRGKGGDLVYRLMPEGSTVVSSLPKKKRGSSPASVLEVCEEELRGLSNETSEFSVTENRAKTIA